MKTVFVYGGLGYIGVSLCLVLKSMGYKVFCINRNASSVRLSSRVNYLTSQKVYIIDKSATDLSIFKHRTPNLIINLIQSSSTTLDKFLHNDLKIHTLLLDHLYKKSITAGYIYISNPEEKSQVGAIKTAMDALSEYYRNLNREITITSICLSPIIDIGMNSRQTVGKVMYHYARHQKKYSPNSEFIEPINKDKAIHFISTLAHAYLNGYPLKEKYYIKGDKKMSYQELLEKETEYQPVYNWIKDQIIKKDLISEKKKNAQFWASIIILVLALLAFICVAF